MMAQPRTVEEYLQHVDPAHDLADSIRGYLKERFKQAEMNNRIQTLLTESGHAISTLLDKLEEVERVNIQLNEQAQIIDHLIDPPLESH